jgi:hypothetical protein
VSYDVNCLARRNYKVNLVLRLFNRSYSLRWVLEVKYKLDFIEQDLSVLLKAGKQTVSFVIQFGNYFFCNL